MERTGWNERPTFKASKHSCCVAAKSNQRTGVVCLTDSMLPVVFVAPAMIEAVMTAFPMAVRLCINVTPSGAPHSASKRKRDREQHNRRGNFLKTPLRICP